MNQEQLLKMIESISQYAETVGGLRKALLAQGFSKEVAEELVLAAVKGTSNG